MHLHNPTKPYCFPQRPPLPKRAVRSHLHDNSPHCTTLETHQNASPQLPDSVRAKLGLADAPPPAKGSPKGVKRAAPAPAAKPATEKPSRMRTR